MAELDARACAKDVPEREAKAASGLLRGSWPGHARSRQPLGPEHTVSLRGSGCAASHPAAGGGGKPGKLPNLPVPRGGGDLKDSYCSLGNLTGIPNRVRASPLCARASRGPSCPKAHNLKRRLGLLSPSLAQVVSRDAEERRGLLRATEGLRHLGR